MIVTSKGIINGVIQDQYGGRGTQFNENGVSTYSLPIKIENAPVGTISFARVNSCLYDGQILFRA